MANIKFKVVSQGAFHVVGMFGAVSHPRDPGGFGAHGDLSNESRSRVTDVSNHQTRPFMP